MNTPNLNKILKHRCGEKWEQRFRSKQLNIDETVTTIIPPLLPESIIKQIHERSEANRTYTHGMNKNQYLLSRMIFCEKCGLHSLAKRINKASYITGIRETEDAKTF